MLQSLPPHGESNGVPSVVFGKKKGGDLTTRRVPNDIQTAWLAAEIHPQGIECN